MKSTSVFFALCLSAVVIAAAQERQDDASLRVYYENGVPIEQITRDGVTIMVSLADRGKLNQVKLWIDNDSRQAINVVPEQIRLHQASPVADDLKIKSQQELERMVDHRVLWKEILIGAAAGLSRNRNTATTNFEAVTNTPYGNAFTYGSAVTTISTPDYELRARWFALGDQVAAVGKNAKEVIQSQYLKKNTIFPGTQLTGTLWFRRNKSLDSGFVEVSIGARNYEFPFPPSALAKAPERPGTQVFDAGKSSEPPVAGSTLQPGASVREAKGNGSTLALGIVAQNWEYRGAQILEIAPDSPAEVAGLHVGDVIDSVDDNRIKNAADLAAALANIPLGSQIRIGYMFKSNLGWMPGAVKTIEIN